MHSAAAGIVVDTRRFQTAISRYLGKNLGEGAIRTYLDMQGIQATPEQIAEIVRRVRKNKERLDKGEMMITFYEIKKLLRQLRKEVPEDELKRIIKQVIK